MDFMTYETFLRAEMDYRQQRVRNELSRSRVTSSTSWWRRRRGPGPVHQQRIQYSPGAVRHAA